MAEHEPKFADPVWKIAEECLPDSAFADIADFYKDIDRKVAAPVYHRREEKISLGLEPIDAREEVSMIMDAFQGYESTQAAVMLRQHHPIVGLWKESDKRYLMDEALSREIARDQAVIDGVIREGNYYELPGYRVNQLNDAFAARDRHKGLLARLTLPAPTGQPAAMRR